MTTVETLTGLKETEAIGWMNQATEVARGSLCLSKRAGTIIVKDGAIIGQGHNGPPLDDLKYRTCGPNSDPKLPDSCVHAEQRAIMDALARNPEKIRGSDLYYIKVDENGIAKRSKDPYCTQCSRLALDQGIGTFALWHEEGIRQYPTDVYNQLSYQNASKR